MPQTSLMQNRKDILLVLLYSPASTDEINKPICGRTRLIKTLFLFQKEVLPALKLPDSPDASPTYDFISWHFGPFSAEVYDDLTFFMMRGMIQAEISSHNPSNAEISEWSFWLDQFGPYLREEAEQEDIGALEECFSLTEIGITFTQIIYDSLTRNQRELISSFKDRLMRSDLASLLRYVYEKYPEKTDKSKIIEKVVGG